MKLKELTDKVKEFEGLQAPGSETALWGDYIEAMSGKYGIYVYSAKDVEALESTDVSADDAKWWLAAYQYQGEYPDRDMDQIQAFADEAIGQ